MESSCTFLGTTPCPSPRPRFSRKNSVFPFPIQIAKHPLLNLKFLSKRPSALKSPEGFGYSPQKRKKLTRRETEDEGDEFVGPVEDTIPEIVTNRMMTRMGFSVGIPLVIGLLFFPFFYYLKVIVKLDVPTWVPFIVSFFFFGSALLGVSYGIALLQLGSYEGRISLGLERGSEELACFLAVFVGKIRKEIEVTLFDFVNKELGESLEVISIVAFTSLAAECEVLWPFL